MPEFDEVLDNFQDNFKENLKKPWFKVALGVVVVLGGYALIKNMASSSSATGTNAAGGEYYIPTGYASGYPEYQGGVGGGDYSFGSTENYDGLLNYMENLQTSQDTTNNAIMSQLDKLAAQIGTQPGLTDSMIGGVEQQNIVAEMKANSELYNGLEGDGWSDLKTSLHDRNQELAAQIGATFDSATGSYRSENGSALYTVTETTISKTENGYTPKGSSNPAKIVVTEGTSKKVTSASYASDSIALAEAGQRYNAAKAAGDKDGMAKAHADAEAIRAQYGYSGGEDGSQVIKI